MKKVSNRNGQRGQRGQCGQRGQRGRALPRKLALCALAIALAFGMPGPGIAAASEGARGTAGEAEGAVASLPQGSAETAEDPAAADGGGQDAGATERAADTANAAGPETHTEQAGSDGRDRSVDEPATSADDRESGPQDDAVPPADRSPDAREGGSADSAAASPLVALIDTGCDADLCERAVSVIGGDPSDSSGHGTSVARMVLGQNPDARILSIKALDADGNGSAEAVCAALRIAMDEGADIVNMSFSSYSPDGTPAVEALVREAVGRGMAVVAAAGNDGADAGRYCPAQIEGVITVGALGLDGMPLGSSNSGSCVDAWIVSSSTSYAAAVASGRLSAVGRGSGWLGSLLAHGDVSTIETFPAEVEYEGGEGFGADFSHATLSLTTHYAYDGNRSSGGSSSVQTSPTAGDRAAQAIYLSISGGGTTGGITYRVDPYGPDYTAWASNGAQAGTTGEGRPLQRIQVKLTGNYASAYDVQYRYYRINYGPGLDRYPYTRLGNDVGWSNWASNGADPSGLGALSNRWITSFAVKLVAKSYTHTVQVRYQNADGTYGGWSNARSGSYAYGAAVPAWSRAADATYNAGSMAAYTAGFAATTKQVSITRKSYYLDVNGKLDGVGNGGVGNYGTFDFNVNGSNVKNDVNDYYQTSLAGSTWTITDIKAKPGYTYDGVAEGATSGTLGTANAQAARLSFHTNTYSVAFDGNGADGGSMPPQNMTCHAAAALSACALSRDGYQFAGWNTQPDGSGTAYADGAEVVNLTLADRATVTLYAQWEAKAKLPRTGSDELASIALASAALAACGTGLLRRLAERRAGAFGTS